MLDVCVGEDDCMIRKDHAPQNLSLLKKIMLNLIRADKTDTARTSLRLKRKRAAWDDDIRMNLKISVDDVPLARIAGRLWL